MINISHLYKDLIPSILFFTKKNESCIVVKSNSILFVLTCLKLHINFRYTILSCISGVDFLNFKYRFSIAYDLLSLNFNSRIRVKIYLNDMDSVCSSVSVYKNANWWEREVWDMYGLYFNKHPDLRRILTDYGFEGYPLRKDFPLSGYIELKYDQNKKRVVIEPLELSQEFRSFIFETPWSTQ